MTVTPGRHEVPLERRKYPLSQMNHAHVTESVAPSPVNEYRGSTMMEGGYLDKNLALLRQGSR